MRSIIIAAQDPAVRLAEADFVARRLRRRLREARRLNIALGAACCVLALAWGIWG